VGKQDLRDGEAEGAKKLFVHRHQAGLADGGARLQFSQVAGAFLVTERAHARAHRPGTHEQLVSQVAAQRQAGREIVLVSSGAVGAGMGALGYEKRPSDLAELQACAAVGQSA